MSKSPLDWWDSIYISPIMMILNQYFNNILPEMTMLYICLVSACACAHAQPAQVYALVNLLTHAYYVIGQLCDYLHIRCFHLPPANARPDPVTH
jgi:hypothetical protein